MTAAMDFDYFEVGMELGSCQVEIAPLLRDWSALFPPVPGSEAAAPAGLLVAVMMRGYLTILDRRPRGNVHAGQRLRWGAPAGCDATLTVAIRCIAKERRNDRPWLTFAAAVDGADGTRHLEGEMRSLWAA